MVRTSQAEKETACLHPEMEAAMKQWLTDRSHPAFLFIGPPGVGKTTMVYRVCKAAQYWVQEFNASHTRTGSSFRQTILPLLTETGVSKWIHPETPNGRAVLGWPVTGGKRWSTGTARLFKVKKELYGGLSSYLNM